MLGDAPLYVRLGFFVFGVLAAAVYVLLSFRMRMLIAVKRLMHEYRVDDLAVLRQRLEEHSRWRGDIDKLEERCSFYRDFLGTVHRMAVAGARAGDGEPVTALKIIRESVEELIPGLGGSGTVKPPKQH